MNIIFSLSAGLPAPEPTPEDILKFGPNAGRAAVLRQQLQARAHRIIHHNAIGRRINRRLVRHMCLDAVVSKLKTPADLDRAGLEPEELELLEALEAQPPDGTLSWRDEETSYAIGLHALEAILDEEYAKPQCGSGSNTAHGEEEEFEFGPRG